MTAIQSKRRVGFGIGIVAALGVVGFLVFGGGDTVTTDNAYVKVDMISLTADVSGPLVSVSVNRNDSVKAGQLLAEVDPEPYRIALAEAQADQQAVRNRILSERADYARLEAELHQAQRDAQYYQRELERLTSMHRTAVSRTQLDAAEQKRDQARAQKDILVQDLASLKAKLAGGPDVAIESHPDYKVATARLEKAQYNLNHTRIVAPADGVVGGAVPMVGERVEAGIPVMSLAREHSVWVEANLKETQLTAVREGQSVEVEVDAYPGQTWHGRVQSLSPATGSEFALIPPQNASGNWVKVVQRLPVKLVLEDAQGKPPLRAGMSAEISIHTGAAGDAGQTAYATH